MNILLTSVGRRSYIVRYFKEALGDEGKVFVSNSVKTIAMQFADGYFLSPIIYDPNYINSILQYCKENQITALLSLFDIDLLVLAKYRDLFELNGIKVILAEPDSVEMCNDKWKTFLFLKNNNLGTPLSYIDIKEVKSSIKKGDLSYPIIIKPRWGMGSIGIYVANNEIELDVLSEKCKRDIIESFLKYESAFTPDDIIIYQEMLVGQEYGIDVINDLSHKFVAAFAKKKVSMRAGETDLGETVSIIPFEHLSNVLSEKIKHEGILSVDCFIVNNQPYITEMNCRISGHYPISHLAGVNYPKQLIQWLKGEDTDPDLLSFKEGLYVTKDLEPIILS